MFKNPFAKLKKMIQSDEVENETDVAPLDEMEKLRLALGGRDNIEKAQAIAETRLLVTLRDNTLLRGDVIREMGLNVFIPKEGGDVHVLVGLHPERLAQL